MATSTMTRPSVHPGGGRGSQSDEPRRPRRWLRLLVLILVLVLLGTGTWLLGFSSVFATRQVDVVGVSVLSEAEVRSAAAAPIGLPLARQDLDAMAQRVAALAPVESVTSERRWPDTVVFTVTERTGVLAIKQGSSYQVVDRSGIAFDDVPRVPDGVLEATTDLTNGPLLVDVAGVAASLPKQLRDDVSSIKATTRSDITMTLDGGPILVWGSADQNALKAQVVRAMLDQKGSFKQIDVSAPHSPAVR